MYDSHMHSNLSFDSTMSMEEACEQAFKNNLQGVCFTEHLDLDQANGEDNLPDYQESIRQVKELQKKWQGQLEICRGVEVGLQLHLAERNKIALAGSQADLIIGSIHDIDGFDLYRQEYSRGKTRKETYRAYLQRLYELVKTNDYFHILGHLDVITRDASFEDRNITMAEFGDEIDAILKAIISQNRGIEINTSGWKYGLSQPHPSLEVVKRYKELGGDVITCGSDAHRVQTVGYKLAEAYAYLREAGFKYVSFFKQGKEEKKPL